MAEVPVVDLQLNDTALQRLPSLQAKKAEIAVQQTGLLTEAQAVRLAPFAKFSGKKKGTNLKNSGTTEFSGSGFNTSAKVKFTAPYAIFVHEGTGIFGPKQAPFTVQPKKEESVVLDRRAAPVQESDDQRYARATVFEASRGRGISEVARTVV